MFGVKNVFKKISTLFFMRLKGSQKSLVYIDFLWNVSE